MTVMTKSSEDLNKRLQDRFAGLINSCTVACSQVTVELSAENLLEVCTALRDEDDFAFAQLSDLCGVDYSIYGQADWETQDTTSTGFSLMRVRINAAGIAIIDMPTAREEFTKPIVKGESGVRFTPDVMRRKSGEEKAVQEGN